MTTREDYEFAAKAAGMEIVFNTAGLPCDPVWVRRWKPLDDDGDSRRLEVACKMRVEIGTDYAVASLWGNKLKSEPLGTDPCAATRTAVFRCAVEMGKILMRNKE